MKKLQKLKVIIIAAGIMLSAVFYVLSGAATDALGGSEDSLIIGGSAKEADISDDNAQAETADKEGREYLSDELKEELRTYIREAIREELVALCEEGYLEQAVNEAASYVAEEAERKKDMVNINTADISELMTLPGIGEKRASDIIAYRDAHGAFNTIEDIMQVSGIKQSSYDKFKDKIYI